MYEIFSNLTEKITELCLSYTNKICHLEVNNKKAWRNGWDNGIETG